MPDEEESFRRFDPSKPEDQAEFAKWNGGMTIDESFKDMKRFAADEAWLVEHFDEIMAQYKGQSIYIFKQVVYPLGNTAESILEASKKMEEQGINPLSAYDWYVPKDDDPEWLKRIWGRPYTSVTIDQAVRLVEEKDNYAGKADGEGLMMLVT